MFRRRISLAVANSSPMNPSLSIQHRIAYFSLSVCWGFGLAILTILASWLIARQSWDVGFHLTGVQSVALSVRWVCELEKAEFNGPFCKGGMEVQHMVPA